MHSQWNLLNDDPRHQAEFCKLLASKPPPTWSIDSKATTPEYNREDQVDEAAHWKRLSELNRQRLLDSGTTIREVEEIRCSNPDANYWKLEAECFDAEFWRLQQLRQPLIKTRKTSKVLPEQSKSTLDDKPISSRLRRRTPCDNKISKNSHKAMPGRKRKGRTNRKPKAR